MKTGTTPYHHGELRAALIDTSFDLLRDTGLAGFSVAALARQLGVSTASPYRHFADREHLLAAVATAAARELLSAMRDAADTAGPDPVDRFASTAAVYVNFVDTRGAGLDLIFSPTLRHLGDHQLAAAGRALMTLLIELAGAAIDGTPVDSLNLIEAHLALAQGFSTLNRHGFLDQARHAATPPAERAHLASLALLRGYIAGQEPLKWNQTLD